MEEKVHQVSFKINNQVYGIDITNVRQFINNPKITKLVGSPPTILGIINLHDEIITIIDIHRILEIPLLDQEKMKKVIILEYKDKKIGFFVDTLLGTINRNIESTLIHKEPETNIVSRIINLEESHGYLLLELSINNILDSLSR